MTFDFGFDQVKQAAVEQIRCVRQTSEEACWQCGRPATETCSGNVGVIGIVGIVGIGIGIATCPGIFKH